MTIKDWNIKEMTGYEPKTTYYTDFSIADRFGIEAIKDTFKRAFEAHKDNTIYGTELAMVLNWKSWEHQNNPKLCRLYVDLYYKMDEYIGNHWTKEQQRYYYKTTD